MSDTPNTLTLGKALTSGFVPAFQRLASISFPDYKTNLNVARSLVGLKDAVDGFHKTRVGLLEQYGTPSATPGEFTLSPEKAPEFQKAVVALLEQPVTLALDQKLKLPKTSTLSGADLAELWELLEIPE